MTHAGQTPRFVARDLPARHRWRLIAPLMNGRSISEWPDASPVQQHDVLLHMNPVRGALAQAQAEAMLRALMPGGVAVVVSQDALPPATLRKLAPYHGHYIQRAINGSLFQAQEFTTGKIAILRDADIRREAVHIYLFAYHALPPLDTGVLEHPVAPERPPTPPAATDAPRPGSRNEEGDAVSLAGRLLAQESRLLRLHTQIRDLTTERARPGQSSGGLEPPSGKFAWRLADQSLPSAVSDDPYDRRVDDPAIHAARQGAHFFNAFRLDTPEADVTAATDALSTRVNRLKPTRGAPDVSIIIPVYGQIAYTLNCLDSLFAHASRYSAEIIVVNDASPDETGILLPRLPQIRVKQQKKNAGFIKSCHAGAAMARGTYLVMLNNDTRVVDGWLDALIGSFGKFPEAGLVGSKMLYPDGSLQEAGGIMWRDGSAWNYGRNDDPNRPHYSYARQADFISGCSLALTRKTWHALGGFDDYYAPAYCEDADLCMRVRQSGKQVWFQPQSRIIHYEGKTGGTDTATGAKRYQVLNTKKFFLRWRGVLAAHRPNAEEPWREKDRATNTHMLIIDATTPRPDQDAGSVQVALVLESCRDLGYAASFVPQDNFLFQPGYTTDLQAAGVECAYAPYERDMDTYLRRYGRMFDVIMVYRITVLDRVLPLLRAHAPQATIIFNLVDLHFLRMQRQAALTEDASLAASAESLRERELNGIRACDCTITHSTVEATLLSELVPEAPVTVWPLMAACQGTDRGFADRRDVLFLGGYLHAPNVDAVQHFVADILPALRQAEPGLRFIIAGANPTAEVAALASDHVEITGQVADLRDVMDRARIFVCPLRVGAGVKGKIMSALSYGIPVVTSSLGMEGSGLTPGEHALVADNPADFARTTLRLYHDPDEWQRLSAAGQAVIRRDFSPQRGASILAGAINAAWSHRLGVPAACA